MPVGDDRLLELLSGYLDDALDEREQVDVESALADPAAQQLLEVLRQNRASVARIAKSSSGLSDDFTSRVMAAIDASPVAEPVQLPDADSNHPTKRSRTTRWLMGIAAVAAAALCIVMVTPPAGDPVDQVAVEITTPDIDPALAVSGQPDIQDRIVEPADVQYVSDLEWRMSMALVLHVAPTPQAQDDGLLQSLLSDAGIRSAAPIVADEQLQSTLLDSEMIVTDESISHSALYYVRAKATAVDAALQKVWGDRTNFPSAYFNLSIDGPDRG